MARKPNYSFQKRQKEAARKKKKAEKQQRTRQGKELDQPTAGVGPDDAPPAAAVPSEGSNGESDTQ